MTGSGNKAHAISFGKCTRCGRNKLACSNVIGCDGHEWKTQILESPSYVRIMFCTVCQKTAPFPWGRSGKSQENYGGKCEPPTAVAVGVAVGPQNPPMKGSASASKSS